MTILTAIFIIAAGIQLFYFLYFFARIPAHREDAAVAPSAPPLSVVICARNEATNLRKNIPFIAGQEYPEYEVIVVNDRSTDDTAHVLEELKNTYGNITVVNVEEQEVAMKGKRTALAKGIAAAKHPLLVLTDADCRPASDHWLKNISAEAKEGKDIILGYSPYIYEPTILNKVIRYETVQAALQYIGFALAGVPYMGTGRNLAYHQSLYDMDVAAAAKTVSGDDDLLINAVATRGNTTVALKKDAFIYSEPKHSWRDWYKQKYRHLATGIYYKWQHQVLLGLYHFSQVLFYVMFLLLMINGFNLSLIITLFAIRLILQWVIYGRALRKLGEYDLVKYIPLLDIFYTLYLIFFAPAVFFNNSNEWQ